MGNVKRSITLVLGGLAGALVVGAVALAVERGTEGPPDSAASTTSTTPPATGDGSTTVPASSGAGPPTETTEGPATTRPVTDTTPTTGTAGTSDTTTPTEAATTSSTTVPAEDDPSTRPTMRTVATTVASTVATTSTAAPSASNGEPPDGATPEREPAIELIEDPAPAEPRETDDGIATGQGEPRTTVPQNQGAGRSLPPATGPWYTWEDGDRTMRVRLHTDLVVRTDGAVVPGDEILVATRAGTIVKQAGDASGGTRGAAGGGSPVFRSESGGLMLLPGGVLLILDPGWDEARTEAFFAHNRIRSDRVSELGLPNWFLVDTEPGFPSLELANALAGQDGVEVSSPNWMTEATTR